MAEESYGAGGLNYQAFKRRLNLEAFDTRQNGPLKLRLDLLESFMERPQVPGIVTTKGMKAAASTDIWTFEPRSLTIVDLSCPFVDESAACVLFDICLGLFLDNRGSVGRVVALDEAHKVGIRTPSSCVSDLHGTVHDEYLISLELYRQSSLGHPATASSCYSRHHCHTRTDHLTQTPGSK